MMRDKLLKPCPFCGSLRDVEVMMKEIDGKDVGVVYCTNCGAQIRRYNDLAGAIELWNSRAPEKILPAPCINVPEETVKDWFQKINEELDELKEAVLGTVTLMGSVTEIQPWNRIKIAEEAADTITAITSMLEAMGIDEQERQKAQHQVNKKNRERGRF